MNKKSSVFVSSVILMSVTLGCISTAEAQRLGGGKSFGSKSSYSAPYSRAALPPSNRVAAPSPANHPAPTYQQPQPTEIQHELDFSDVHGQYHVKRAFEIAAAGAHNLLMLGPPGTRKSMLAARLPTILPFLTEEQAQETAAIASISDQGLDVANWLRPPYRAPHHSASAAALVGGGSNPRPGEISLSHYGTLFLDELPEFDRKVL